MHGLRPVAARQAQDLARAADVGRLQLRVRVDEVHHRAGVDDQVHLCGQRVELPLVHAEQTVPEVPGNGHDALRPLGPPQPVAPQVGLDGLHTSNVPAGPDEAVDAGVCRREQPVEQEGPQEPGRPGKEDVAGVPQGRRAFRGGLRGYLGVEYGLGCEVLGGRHFACLPVALQRLDPVEQPSRRRVLHEQRHGDVYAEALFDAAGELRGGERVPAEVEEVVLGPDLALVQAQHVLPGPHEQRLLLRARGSLRGAWRRHPCLLRAGRGGGGGSSERSTLPEVAWMGSDSSSTKTEGTA